MIRPCDNCEGTSIVYDDSGKCSDCPRCVNMPWLSGQGWDWLFDDKERWKPDPDTVLRWCETHQTAAAYTGAKACDLWRYYTNGGFDMLNDYRADCRMVWIERPSPLKEADDE